MTVDEAKVLKNNVHLTFDTDAGQETMKYMEKIGSWFPTVYDTNDTNDIIARDANRKLIGTLKSIMTLSAEQISKLTEE